MEGLEGGGKQSGGKWGKCVRAALTEGSQNLPSAKHQQGLDGVFSEVLYSHEDAQKFHYRVLWFSIE